MALRVKMSAEATLRAEMARKRARITSIAIASVIGLAGGLMLWLTSILIETQQEAQFIVYQSNEDRVDMNQKEVVDISGGTPPKGPEIEVSVTTTITAIDTPTMDLSSVMDTSAFEFSMGGMESMSMGIGNGYGEGNSAGMGNSEGGGSTFCGRFWDLKKTRRGDASTIGKNPLTSNSQTLSLISRFFNEGWKTSVFDSYYESKVKLYTNCFLMPNCLDNEASNAFDPNGKMGLKPSRWVALYQARVKAPVSGRFRFVGAADSVMGVRFNKQNVLSCGFHDLHTGEWNAIQNEPYRQGKEFFQYASCGRWNKLFSGFVAGEIFTVEAGQWYEMEVLLSEIGGGEFGFCLLIDEVDERRSKKKDRAGFPIFQIFRTNGSMPDVDELYAQIKFKDAKEEMKVHPPFDADSMVWEAKALRGN